MHLTCSQAAQRKKFWHSQVRLPKDEAVQAEWNRRDEGKRVQLKITTWFALVCSTCLHFCKSHATKGGAVDRIPIKASGAELWIVIHPQGTKVLHGKQSTPVGGNKGGDLPGKVQCFLIEVLTKLLVEMSKGFGVSKGRKAASATRSQCYRHRRESSDGTESVVILLLWPSCLSSHTATENTQNLEKIPQNPFRWLFKKQVKWASFSAHMTSDHETISIFQRQCWLTQTCLWFTRL